MHLQDYWIRTYSTESNLSTDNQPILEAPVIITHCAPGVVVAHLHTTSVGVAWIPIGVQSHQPSCTLYNEEDFVKLLSCRAYNKLHMQVTAIAYF